MILKILKNPQLWQQRIFCNCDDDNYMKDIDGPYKR